MPTPPDAASPHRISLKVLSDLIYGWQLAFNASRSLAAGWLVLSVAAGLAPMALLLAARFAITRLSDDANAALPDTTGIVAAVVGATALVYLLKACSDALRGRLANTVQEAVLERLLAVVNRLPPSFFDRTSQQDLLHRARVDALAQPVIAFEASGALIQTGLFFTAVLIFLLHQSWVYPLLLLSASIPAVLIFAHATLVGQAIRRRDTFLQRLSGYFLYLLTDRSAVPELRVTGASSAVTARLRDARMRLDKSAQRQERIDLYAALGAGVGMLVSMAVGVHWMLQQYHGGLLSVGDLAISFYAFVIAHRMAVTVLDSVAKLYRSGMFLGDLRKLLGLREAKDQEPSDTEIVPAKRITLKQGICIRGLSFSYPGADQPVFSNLNLEIPANQITVLTGPNGRGKSTLLKLIAGLYKPDAGEILIDGESLQHVDEQDWRASLSFMFQDLLKLAGTVEENVELGRSTTPRSWIMAEQFGQLAPLLAHLPDAKHTQLMRGLGGYDLSGGEWQRVALARAIATCAPILLFDEPTSSLDPAARARFWATLPEFSAARTVICASHDDVSSSHGATTICLP